MNNKIEEYKRKISELQDGFDVKEAEILLLKSQLVDDLRPAILMTEITFSLSEMLFEYLDAIKGKTETERMKKSKSRLIDVLYKAEKLNSITTQMNTLKLVNRELFSKIQHLRVENTDLKAELKKIADAEKFANEC